jgi:hypothetical protein
VGLPHPSIQRNSSRFHVCFALKADLRPAAIAEGTLRWAAIASAGGVVRARCGSGERFALSGVIFSVAPPVPLPLERPGDRLEIEWKKPMSPRVSPFTFSPPPSPALFIPGATRDLAATRRGLLVAPLVAPFLAALPLAVTGGPAFALNPSETQITLPDQFPWKPWSEGPPHSAEIAALFGDLNRPGEYVVAMKWYPGYMSAPHTYVTDRLCFVLSGTWWVNSGDQFEPNATVPVPAGGFVRRVAHTPHYDGVKSGQTAPAIIGIFGEGPVNFKLVDPSKPQWRAA